MHKTDYYRLIKKYLFKLGIKDQARFLYHLIDDLKDRNVLKKNKSLENLHKGKRCFILGGGLSVNDINFSKLTDEYTFGGNFLNYHHDFHRLKINFFVCPPSPSALKHIHEKAVYTDSKIFSEKDIKVWLDDNTCFVPYPIDPNVYFNKIDTDINNNTFVFLGAGSKKFIEKNKIFKNKNVYYLKPYKPVLEAKNQIIDITKRITIFENVIFMMMAIVMYMGFKEIYLSGNDYTFEPAREFHFYDSLVFSKTIEKRIAFEWINRIAKARNIEVHEIMEDEDFYKPVFVKYNKNRDAYMVVKNFAESKKVKIFNIVPKGFESPIYEKITWVEVVNKLDLERQ